MTWRRNRRDLAGQGAFIREEIEDAEPFEWPKGFLPIGKGQRGLDLGLLKGRPVGLMHNVTGTGERRARVGPPLTQIPADMVGMQVCEEDGVHLLGTYSRRLQFR